MNRTAKWCARMAAGSTVFFFLVMYVAFIFIQPELNPLYRWGSEYAVGRMGWLMNLGFFLWGTGLAAFALSMAYGLDPESKSWTAIVLFVIAGTGIFMSGMFNADLQVLNENPPPRWIEAPPSDEQKLHAIAGLIGLPTLVLGAGLVSRRLRIAGRLSGEYRWLRPLSWLIVLTLLALMFAFEPIGLKGLGQRIFLACAFAWIILASRGLSRGAFRPDH